MSMKLKILVPTKIFLEKEVAKVTAEAANGSFCLLPRHVDFVAALQPGLLFFETKEGEEIFLAVDEGILVKCGQEVRVSTRNAVQAPNLGEVRKTVEEEFRNLDEREKKTRTAVAKIEAGFVRRFLELQQHG
jgi:F-type H+-transporting ATPase subunit epsilon